ncbi:hypothetical protein ACLB2K_062845 [Fragaria x ananassa]
MWDITIHPPWESDVLVGTLASHDRVALIPFVTSQDTFRCNTILSALGPPALTVLFPAAQEQLPTVPVINLNEDESDIEIKLTEEDFGRIASSLGMYSYVARIKNKQRRPAKRDDIYWWGEVKKTREKKAKEIAEERKKNLEQKKKNKIQEGVELTEHGDVIYNISDDEMEPMLIQIVPAIARPIRIMTKKAV